MSWLLRRSFVLGSLGILVAASTGFALQRTVLPKPVVGRMKPDKHWTVLPLLARIDSPSLPQVRELVQSSGTASTAEPYVTLNGRQTWVSGRGSLSINMAYSVDGWGPSMQFITGGGYPFGGGIRLDLQGLKPGVMYLAMFTVGSNGATVRFSDDQSQAESNLTQDSHYISFPFVPKNATQSVWLSLPKSDDKDIHVVQIFNAEVYALK